MTNPLQFKNNQQQTSRLQQWLENIWYQGSKGYIVLLPLSAVYCIVNALQRWLKSSKINTLPCPVVIVGNITVGGTGKTPLTLKVVALLQKAGYKPAIITRGYGGKSPQSLPVRVTSKMSPTEVGDEAVLMASRSGVPVYVGADRVATIKKLLDEQDCDVIVSDDGMQHYKLPRDIQIAVIDQSRQLGNGWCLPAGPLREPKQRLSGCDFIVVNGSETLIEKKPTYTASVPEFSMQLSGKQLINLKTKQEKPLTDFVGETVNAVSGIGNPQRFFDTLQNAGLTMNTQSFPDHHPFTASDFTHQNTHSIIMTEKDAVKCQAFATENMWYLPVTATLDGAFESVFLNRLAQKFEFRSHALNKKWIKNG